MLAPVGPLFSPSKEPRRAETRSSGSRSYSDHREGVQSSKTHLHVSPQLPRPLPRLWVPHSPNSILLYCRLFQRPVPCAHLHPPLIHYREGTRCPPLGTGLPAKAYVQGDYALQCTPPPPRIFPSCLPDSLSCILNPQDLHQGQLSTGLSPRPIDSFTNAQGTGSV